MYLSNYDQGIPVIVNNKFIEETEIEIGEKFIFNASGSYIPMKIEREINYFSGTSEKYDSFLIADLKLLKNYMELTKLQSFRPNELVVLIDDGFQENSSKYIEENFPLSTIKDKSLIEQNSGSIVSNVTKKLDYLIIGEKPTNRKVDAAKNLGVKILDQSSWLKMLK